LDLGTHCDLTQLLLANKNLTKLFAIRIPRTFCTLATVREKQMAATASSIRIDHVLSQFIPALRKKARFFE
jgi:predicted metal-dependent phosphotriesterase family hydrolase